jgi:hypothetical protein
MGLFGSCPRPPRQISGAPIFWQGICPPLFRQRAGVKSELATDILVWLVELGFNPNAALCSRSTPKFWKGNHRQQSKQTLNVTLQRPSRWCSVHGASVPSPWRHVLVSSRIKQAINIYLPSPSIRQKRSLDDRQTVAHHALVARTAVKRVHLCSGLETPLQLLAAWESLDG